MSGRGFFLVLEGPEGAGKTTLGAALAARLRAAGTEPLAVREPGGTEAGEAARRILLDGEHPLGPAAELFLILAARAELVRQVIAPALAAGRFVLADRYELSTLAYQVAGRGLPRDAVEQANALATGGLAPDLVLVLDLDPAEGRRRQEDSGKLRDRLDRESEAFHRRVGAWYREAQGPALRHLDAAQPPAAVADAAWQALRAAWHPEGVRGV